MFIKTARRQSMEYSLLRVIHHKPKLMNGDALVRVSPGNAVCI